MWRQGIGSFVRDSYVSTRYPVVVCPHLCTSEAHQARAQPRARRQAVHHRLLQGPLSEKPINNSSNFRWIAMGMWTTHISRFLIFNLVKMSSPSSPHSRTAHSAKPHRATKEGQWVLRVPCMLESLFFSARHGSKNPSLVPKRTQSSSLVSLRIRGPETRKTDRFEK